MTEQTQTQQRRGRPPEHGPRRNVTMALPIEQIEALDRIAEERQTTRTEYVRQAIDEKMEREQ